MTNEFLEELSKKGHTPIVNKLEIIEAPDFAFSNNRRKFSRINPDYSIVWDDKSNRTFYAREKGPSGIYLSGDGGFSSDSGDLGYSNDNGQVVAVDAEGATSKDK